MAHFAQLDDDNKVLQVIVIGNADIGEPELSYPDTEPLGQAFISNVLKLGGVWKQTSYNNNYRKQYAGIGYEYDEDGDVFVSPQPYPSWSLDDDYDWQAPTAKPDGDYVWNEDEQEWVEAPE